MERVVEILFGQWKSEVIYRRKEAIKLAIGQANNLNELLQVAFTSLAIDAHR